MPIRKPVLKESKLWIFIYSDWITNLTLFFILVYASVLLALDKGLTSEEYKQQMQNFSTAIYDQSNYTEGRLQKLKDTLIQIEGIKVITSDTKEMRILLPEPILFNSGEAKIRDFAKPILVRIGGVIALIHAKIIVEGYATDISTNQKTSADMPQWAISVNRLTTGLGPYRSNWELSADRANKVTKFFIMNGYVEESKIIACAKGPTNPYSNVNIKGKDNSKVPGIEIRLVLDKTL